MADIITYRNLAELKTWNRNYREGDVGAIITSIARFGFNGALRVWQDDTVIAGNHTLLALRQMKANGADAPRGVQEQGNVWTIPTIDVTHLSPIEAQAFAIADNRTTELATNDDTTLATLLQELANEDMRLLEATGYDGDDLDVLLEDLGMLPGQGKDDPGAQMDRADELLQKWGVARGDVWQIGRHRLMCGDSTSAEDVARLMAGERADIMVTDPPYNVAQDTELFAQNRSKALKALAESEWDYNFKPVDFLEATKGSLKSDCWQYVFTAHHLFGGIFDWMNNQHAKASFCVWCKPNPMPSLTKRTWTFAVELCLFGKSGAPVFNFPEGEHCLNWWAISKSSDGSHPTQKPLEVITHILKHCSNPDYVVSDFFGGSGTTMVACEQLARQCRMMEIEPKYCAVILERMSGMGLTPHKVNE